MIDHSVQDLLNQLAIKDPNLKCSEGNRIEWFCINKACKSNALFCDQATCQRCSQAHEQCISGKMVMLTQQVSIRVNKNTNFIFQMCKIEEELISQLNKTRNELIKAQSTNIHESLGNVIESIYYKGTSQGLNGKDLANLYTELTSSDREKKISLYMQQFEAEKNTLAKVIISSRERLLRAMMMTDKSINSKILNGDPYEKEKTDFLLWQLDNPKDLNLLFRASQHKFDATQFHKFCNNIPDTVTIVRTQFNKTIAAYTPLQWKSVGKLVDDPEGKSFILILDRKEKLTIIKGKQSSAIYDDPTYGPTFGDGHDLYIADSCNTTNCYANIAATYNCNGNYQIDDQSAYTALSGAAKGSNFFVLQYEVYQVIHQ